LSTPNVGEFSGLTREAAQAACCASVDGATGKPNCAGFSFGPDAGNVTGGGFYKGNTMCGFTADAGYEGYALAGQVPSGGGASADITITFADVNLFGSVSVYDIWARASLGAFTGSYTARNVPYHGTAFLRLSAAA
jgi:Alpha galactosidase C-terminal beta sandwich domain